MLGARYLRLLALLAAAGVLAAVAWGFSRPATLTAAVASRPRPAAGALPWLSTLDGRIVDERGRTVLLRGFNDDALLHYPWRTPPPLEATDADLISRSGFDVVRLPISWDLIEPRRGVIDQAYLDRVQATVGLLTAHRLYAILDLHFLPGWGEAFDAGTAPAWMRLPLVPNVNWARVDPFGKDTNPAEVAAETHFWTSPDWQTDFDLAWRSVAQRFAGDSGVAGYDLYNEAHPFPIPPRLFEQWYLWPLYQRTIEAIGQLDPNHLFIVESTLFADQPTAIVPLAAPDLVYSPHLYTAALVPRVLSPGPDPLRRSVEGREREAALLPAALWFGELGIGQTSPDAAGWADQALAELDGADAGWAWWQWRQDAGWGVRDEDGDRLNLDFLRHLARPYLEAAPPGVTMSGADGVAGRLDLRVAASATSGPLSVSWSSLTLPPPVATGECVAGSSYDASRGQLTIRLAGGAGCTIRIRAA